MNAKDIKTPKFDGDMESMRRELRAFCTQVVSVITYVENTIEELAANKG